MNFLKDKAFLAFLGVASMPVVVMSALLIIPGFIINVIIILIDSSGVGELIKVIEFSAVLIVAVFLIIFIAKIIYGIFLNSKNRFWSVFSIYAVVLSYSFVFAFFVVAGLGGMSMAVVENGSASVIERYLVYLAESLKTLLPLHFLIVPWVSISFFWLRRINRENKYWPKEI